MRYLSAVMAVMVATSPLFAASGSSKNMENKPTSVAWGTSENTPVELWTLTNKNGLTAKIATYGATLIELHTPDKNGKLDDIVLGFDTLSEYKDHSPYFGATIGRVGNRIAKGKFTLDGKSYTLAVNNGANHLHGGLKGFDKVVWKAKPANGSSITFTHTSPDGDEGYPGKLDISVTYTLTDDNVLRLEYTAKTTAATPVNLTNHSYFNLAGGTGTIKEHRVTLAAPFYTPVDEGLIPTGEISSVVGTPFDFLAPHTIGERLASVGANPSGYDHNFIAANGGTNTPGFAARVEEPTSGRVMELYTTEPGFQFYTGNFLSKMTGKAGKTYDQYSAFCLETQHFPDSINRPQFPSVVLRPGQTYHTVTEYRFSVAK